MHVKNEASFPNFFAPEAQATKHQNFYGKLSPQCCSSSSDLSFASFERMKMKQHDPSHNFCFDLPSYVIVNKACKILRPMFLNFYENWLHFLGMKPKTFRVCGG